MTTKKMKTHGTCALLTGLLAMLFAACTAPAPPAATEPAPSAETLRLSHATHTDSTLLWVRSQWPLVDGLLPAEDSLAALSAEAWMLVDDATGLIISQRAATRRMFMASLTKMMTCLLTLESGMLHDTVTVTEDVYKDKDGRVRPGDSYTAENLMAEMMMVSDNDAARALAKHVGHGDTLAFYRLMNEKAKYLGMADTHFANPNGMPCDSNYSTAADLTRLVRYCMADTAFARLVGTAERDIPLTDGRHLPCNNTNALLTTYDGCTGVKTGYTRLAGWCLASSASRPGTTLTLVLLKSDGRSARFTESAALLDYGFRVMEAIRNPRN